MNNKLFPVLVCVLKGNNFLLKKVPWRNFPRFPEEEVWLGREEARVKDTVMMSER
jgi:hypothetical protein